MPTLMNSATPRKRVSEVAKVTRYNISRRDFASNIGVSPIGSFSHWNAQQLLEGTHLLGRTHRPTLPHWHTLPQQPTQF
jgi:hypothetical protein